MVGEEAFSAKSVISSKLQKAVVSHVRVGFGCCSSWSMLKCVKCGGKLDRRSVGLLKKAGL